MHMNSRVVAGQPAGETSARGMIRYVVPERCIFCGAAGRVTLTARTAGGGVAIAWHCGDCDRHWPLQFLEPLPERRSGLDRRRSTRADRRKRMTAE